MKELEQIITNTTDLDKKIQLIAIMNNSIIEFFTSYAEQLNQRIQNIEEKFLFINEKLRVIVNLIQLQTQPPQSPLPPSNYPPFPPKILSNIPVPIPPIPIKPPLPSSKFPPSYGQDLYESIVISIKKQLEK